MQKNPENSAQDKRAKLIKIIILASAAAVLIAVVITLCCLFIKKDKGDNGENENPPATTSFTVIFDANGGAFANGEETLSVVVDGNSFVAQPQAPTLKNYGLVGWTKEKDGKSFWVFSTDLVTEDITLYASWSNENFLLTVDTGDETRGTVVKSAEGMYLVGDTVKLTAIPHPGYVFKGWYEAGSSTPLSTDAVFEIKVPLRPVALFAQFEIAPEMAQFTFTSTANTCVISELTDKSATSIVIPDCVTSFDPSTTFQNNDVVKSVVVGDGIEQISLLAFNKCSALESVVIGKKVKKIANMAFAGCTSLKSIIIPSNVKSIGDEAFSGCTSLENVVLEDGVEEIGYQAFISCTALKTITLGKKLAMIKPNAFANCNALKEANFVNAKNWYYASTLSSTGAVGRSIEETLLLSPSKAAKLLRSDYLTYYWQMVA